MSGSERDVIARLAAALAAGEPVVLATVVRTSRSVPRRPGSKMLVWPDGSITGTVGGGEMEHRVKTEAAAALADGQPRLLAYSLVDPAEGDPGVCGGDAEIYLEPHMPDPVLFIVGAGHVGRAVAELGRWLGHRIVLWDDRPDVLAEAGAPGNGDGTEEGRSGPSDRPGDGEVHLSVPIGDALATHPPRPTDAIVMVTRNVALDRELLPTLLASDAGYIGLMGSARRWRTTRSLLATDGVPEADLDRIHAPIGIEIQAETPAEIAVSIMAEVVAHQRGA